MPREKPEDFRDWYQKACFTLSMQCTGLLAVVEGQGRPTEEIHNAELNEENTEPTTLAPLPTPGFLFTRGVSETVWSPARCGYLLLRSTSIQSTMFIRAAALLGLNSTQCQGLCLHLPSHPPPPNPHIPPNTG